MDSGIIRHFQEGQKVERDLALASLLIERGLLTSEEAHDLRRSCPPGTFGPYLVGKGKLSSEQLEELEREGELREILEAAKPIHPPDEVTDATRIRIGKYELVKRVGKGGMGEVWKAWDGQLRRAVAIKFLRSDDLVLLQRLAREATLASQLSHPGITRVYEIVTHPPRPFLALEFIDGPSLEGQKRERKRAAEIVRQVALAVQHAHEKGIIHRDLKPANLLEATDGRIFVTDFGLARTIEHGATLTESGTPLGTPAYMAPEQIRGTPPDLRTDVYGLGTTLYSLVEGKPPYTGNNNYEIFQRVLQGRPPRLALQDDLARIAQKAMRPDPKDRYASSLEVAEDLERYLKGDPIRARPLGTTTLVLRRVGRHPILACLVALLVASAGVVGTILVRKSKTAARLESERELDKRRQRADAEVEEAREALVRMEELWKSSISYNEKTLQKVGARFESRIQAALREVPDHRDALYFLAHFRFIENDFPGCIAQCTRLLERDPSDVEARLLRANARWVSVGLPIEGYVTSHGFRVQVRPYSRDKQTSLKAAMEDYALVPRDHEMYDLGRARTARTSGRYLEAKRILLEIVTNRGWPVEAYHDLAVLEMILNSPASARRWATKALERRIAFPATVFQLRAFASAVEGRWKEAIGDIEISLSLLPEERAMRELRAVWLTTAKRFAEAVEAYARLIREQPKVAGHWSRRSTLHAKLGDHAEAIRDALQAVSLQPEDPRHHLFLGLRWEESAYARRRSQDEASALQAFARSERAYSEAIERGLKSRLGFRGRARVRMATNRYAEALADLEKAGDVRPGEGRITIILDGVKMIKMEFVQIHPGRFMMGSKEGSGTETPAHEVTISKGFWMQTTEVTQAQWRAVVGANPSGFLGDDLPVENVKWGDCREFLKRLNEKVKGQLRGRRAGLPTEAEWEYACRAGTVTKWCFGDEPEKLGEYAWYEKNSGKKTHPVGLRKANAWGLYDMHGNVWEWCEDDLRGFLPEAVTDPRGPPGRPFHAMKGGSWFSPGANTRSATRGSKDDWFRDLGLRVLLR